MYLKEFRFFSKNWVESLFKYPTSAREYILHASRVYNQSRPQMKVEDISKDEINKMEQRYKLPYSIDDKIYNDFIRNGFKKESQYFLVHVRQLSFYLYKTFTYCFGGKVTEEEINRYSVFSEVITKSILENEDRYLYIRASFIIAYCRQLKWNRSLYGQSSLDNNLNDHLFSNFAPFVGFFITNDGNLQDKCNELKYILPISVKSFNDWMDI